jgi:hypothetical protein
LSTVLTRCAPPETSIYDAIFSAQTRLIAKAAVLVLITDGGDTTSKADYNSLRRAQQAEAIVYSIIVVPVADAYCNWAASTR